MVKEKILLPLSPEYSSYADAGLSSDMFISYQPTISMLKDSFFKYHVDFSKLVIDDSIATIAPLVLLTKLAMYLQIKKLNI